MTETIILGVALVGAVAYVVYVALRPFFMKKGGCRACGDSCACAHAEEPKRTTLK